MVNFDFWGGLFQGEPLEEDEDKTASEDEEEDEEPHLPAGHLGQKRKEREGQKDEEESGVSDSDQQSGPPSEDGTEEEEEEDWHTCSEEEGDDDEQRAKNRRPQSDLKLRNSSRLLHKDELLSMFKSAHSGPTYKEGQVTVGLVSLTPNYWL